ncbi:MAG: hypothetical protein Q4C67_05950, partial [Deinococcus sp.]|nr:hypothetical protein [Deinococcus sp.]
MPRPPASRSSASPGTPSAAAAPWPRQWLGLLLGVLLPLLLVGWLGDKVLEGERLRSEAPLMLTLHGWTGGRLDALAVWLHFWGGPR